MSDLDLLKIARIETESGLFEYLDALYQRADIAVPNCPDAVIWEGGNHSTGIEPIVHSFTDKFALNGTLMATDVLGLPFLKLVIYRCCHYLTKRNSAFFLHIFCFRDYR